MHTMQIKTQYNSIGRQYLIGQKEFFSKRENESIKFIRSALPPLRGKNLLDIGCGDGTDIAWYQQFTKKVFGIDSSDYMIEQARLHTIEPNNVHVGDIKDLPFPKQFFHVVTSRFSLHYIWNIDTAFKEIARVLQPGGYFVFVAHHPLRDLLKQRRKEYGYKEIIRMKLYQNKVQLHFPSHTFKEYLSKEFLNNFNLRKFVEEKSPEEYLDTYKTPGFIGIQAIRR